MWWKKGRCEGQSGESFGDGKFSSSVANWNCLNWLVQSHSLAGTSGNTLPSHCSLIRANPLELQNLGWSLLKLGGRRGWLKGSSGTGLYHADLGAILTGPELLSGYLGWLVTANAALCSPARWNFTAVFAAGQQLPPKDLVVLDISFHTHGIFKIFFSF